ncbi:MAG: PEP-CTERM sorting domain-containing protein [Planctomycetaceae bacterium]
MRSQLLCISFAMVSALMAGGGQTLHADIVVEVDSTSLTIGGSGTVDVWVYSEDGEVNVAAFGFDFDIVANPANVGSLSFSDPQLLSETLDADYIFLGEADPLHMLGASPLELEGSDLNVGANGYSVLGSTRKLLAQLDVTHSLPSGTDPSLALGDTFTIAPNFLDGFFEFYDDAGDLILIDETLSFGGNITMSPTAAVPEPTSFAALFIGGISWASLRAGRRRKSNTTS